MAWLEGRKLAYFKMINDSGGVNGRKLNLISLDDGLARRRRWSKPAVSSRTKTSL